MLLRNEVNDKLVITVDDAHLRNVYATIVYEITDDGLSKITNERWRVGTDSATRLHNATVAKIQSENNAPIIHYCACGETARQYSRIAREWLCETCWDIKVGERY